MSGFSAKHKNTKEISSFSIVMISYIVALLMFFGLLSLFAFYITKYHTQQGMMQFFVLADSAVVAFAVSLLCSLKVKTKKLIYGMAVSLLVCVTEFILILCINNAQLSWQTYIMFPLTVIISFSGCIIGSNIRRK